MNPSLDAPARSRRARRAQLSDEVAGHLRSAIMSGTLAPGTFIRLDDTAAQLDVSITPVREALLTLRGEGMVRLEPHRGHVVLPLTREDIDDIFWLQSTIATEMARTAAQRITAGEIDEMEGLTDQLESAVADQDIDAVVTAEFQFHRVFNRASGRMKMAWFLLHASRYTPATVYAADPQWGVLAIDNHRRLVAALRARDAEEAMRLTKFQFDDGARRLTEKLAGSGIWS